MRTSLLIVLLTGSCVLTPVSVMKGDPHPNVAFVSPPGKSLSLRIAPDVPDKFTVPPRNGVRDVGVNAWRETLAAAFRNGFGKYFTIAKEGEPSDLVFEISRADLEFSPTAVSRGSVSGVQGQVIYQ